MARASPAAGVGLQWPTTRILNAVAKSIGRSLARQIGRVIPPPKSRLTGNLAKRGGKPVRNIRFRPWHDSPNSSASSWYFRVGPSFKEIFLSGREGLPQTRQREFAADWAQYCGCKYGLMLPHGTDALRLGLAALFDHDGLEYGGEVLVPNLSFIASATSALDRRFGVAFVDVDPRTLNMHPGAAEQAIIPGRTRAIMAVHQFGQPADMTALSALARKHNLKLVEDAAQAHGARWETGAVGSLGDIAAFSLQSAKNLNCGEGGILTTNLKEVFDRAYMLHNVGRLPEKGGRWEHETLGWNCRPTEYQAALLLERLRLFERQQNARAINFKKLRELLREVSCVRPLDVHPGVRAHGMYMFVLRYNPERCSGLGIDDFLELVRAEGIPVYRCYSSTLSAQPVMRRLATHRPDYIRALSTPVADRAVQEIIYISGNVFLGTTTDMEDIAAAFRKVEMAFR